VNKLAGGRGVVGANDRRVESYEERGK